jgi:hypothetical protein
MAMEIIILEMMMIDKLRKQVIICSDRNREVEVTYTVSGNWFSPNFDVVACPAMYDGEVGCERNCVVKLSGSTSNVIFLQNRT